MEERADDEDAAPEGACAPCRWGTVLLVDDDRFVSEAVAILLQGSGARVLLARDGLTAIRLFRAHHRRIDLVVLDLCLPGPSGLEVRQAVRELSPEMPIVVTTAEQCDQPRDAIAVDRHATLLPKPYLIRDLEQSYAQLRVKGSTRTRYRRRIPKLARC